MPYTYCSLTETLLGSSMVEPAAVNRVVRGSSPLRGASFFAFSQDVISAKFLASNSFVLLFDTLLLCYLLLCSFFTLYVVSCCLSSQQVLVFAKPALKLLQ